MRRYLVRLAGGLGLGFGFAIPARAGMTMYDLNDVVRLRLEEISFFAVMLLLCALGIRFLWNHAAKDFSGWPRLTYGRALSLTVLLSLGTLLVLSMISGARELLTPGAWRKQGTSYKLNSPAGDQLRQQSLASLRSALHDYAQAHQGRYPPHDFVAGIPDKLWLLFGVIMSASGLGQQIKWLTQNKERLYVIRPRPDSDLRWASEFMESAVLASNGRLEKTRQFVLAEPRTSWVSQQFFWERYQLLFFGHPDGSLRAVVVCPRDANARDKAGFAVLRPKERSEFHPYKDLASVLASFQNDP